MSGRRSSAFLLAALLGLASPLVACDREDRQDVKEGINDVEDAVDDADTDGKDDK